MGHTSNRLPPRYLTASPPVAASCLSLDYHSAPQLLGVSPGRGIRSGVHLILRPGLELRRIPAMALLHPTTTIHPDASEARA